MNQNQIENLAITKQNLALNEAMLRFYKRLEIIFNLITITCILSFGLLANNAIAIFILSILLIVINSIQTSFKFSYYIGIYEQEVNHYASLINKSTPDNLKYIKFIDHGTSYIPLHFAEEYSDAVFSYILNIPYRSKINRLIAFQLMFTGLYVRYKNIIKKTATLNLD